MKISEALMAPCGLQGNEGGVKREMVCLRVSVKLNNPQDIRQYILYYLNCKNARLETGSPKLHFTMFGT